MSKKRAGLASNPLDAVVPTASPPASKETAKVGSTIKAVKKRCTFHISEDVADKARDVVWWTPGLTLADLVERAMRSEIERMEKAKGEPFPKRESELKPGGAIR